MVLLPPCFAMYTSRDCGGGVIISRPRRCVFLRAGFGSPWTRAKLRAHDRWSCLCRQCPTSDHDDSADLPFGLHHWIYCGSCLIVSPWFFFLSPCDAISGYLYVHVLFLWLRISWRHFVRIPVEFLFVMWGMVLLCFLWSWHPTVNVLTKSHHLAPISVSCSLAKHALWTWTHVTELTILIYFLCQKENAIGTT